VRPPRSDKRRPGQPRRLADGLLFGAALFLALGAAELGTRLMRLDQRLITPVLFFQDADAPNFRVSRDPVLRYETAPGTRNETALGGRQYRVTIDEHGARYPTHPATKAPGVFRILCFGPSTLYGSAVNDEETTPAALERRLNVAAPAGVHYEVWNFGACGYTASQAAHLARMRFGALDPDLVLVQLARHGRRAFLMPRSGRALDYPWTEIVADPDLFEEQFEYWHWLPAPLLRPVLQHSAFARACTAALPGFRPSGACPLCEAMEHNEAQLLSEEAEARGVPVFYYSIPAYRGLPKADSVFPGFPDERFIDLYRPDREAAFYEVHPPPPILDEFAELLAEALQTRTLLTPINHRRS
jgi:hypothetical protein